MRPLRCSMRIRLHGMSKWTRSWHCLCRLTPSEATSPVTSTRIGVDARWNSSTTPAAPRRAGRRAAQRRRRQAARAVAAARSRSQFSVATRSANTTTRVVLFAADADRPAGAPPARRTWPSRRPAPQRRACRAGSAQRPRRRAARPCPTASAAALRTVSTSAAGEERNALASIHGNSWRPAPEIRRTPLCRVQPHVATARRRRRPRPRSRRSPRTLGLRPLGPHVPRPRGRRRASAGAAG